MDPCPAELVSCLTRAASAPGNPHGFPVLQTEPKKVIYQVPILHAGVLHTTCTTNPCYTRMSCIAKLAKFKSYRFDSETNATQTLLPSNVPANVQFNFRFVFNKHKCSVVLDRMAWYNAVSSLHGFFSHSRPRR